MDIVTAKQLKEGLRFEQVQVRLPKHLREKAKRIARAESNGRKVTETDIYRTAIVIFLATISTDSRVNLVEGVMPGERG